MGSCLRLRWDPRYRSPAILRRLLRRRAIFVSVFSPSVCPSHFEADVLVVLAANIDMAIRACREEHGQVLQNHENMQVVKEALNEGYCDVSGWAGDLKLLGTTVFFSFSPSLIDFLLRR